MVKKYYLEETLNDHHLLLQTGDPLMQFIGLHKELSKRVNQVVDFKNGFAFFENGLGFNFKSIDKMIEDSKSTNRKDKYKYWKTKIV